MCQQDFGYFAEAVQAAEETGKISPQRAQYYYEINRRANRAKHEGFCTSLCVGALVLCSYKDIQYAGIVRDHQNDANGRMWYQVEWCQRDAASSVETSAATSPAREMFWFMLWYLRS